MLDDNRLAFAEAYKQDLGWETEELYLLELDRCLDEVLYLESSLTSLTSPTRVSGGLAYPFSRPHIIREPFGLCCILAPWNYPLQLSIMPLAGAIAAGNVVILKLSEIAPTINTLLFKLLSQTLDPALYRVLQGEAELAKALVQQPTLDFVLFTGSGTVGKEVHKACAEHLTPCALELGGACCAVVDGSFDIDLAAKRIAWAKFTNGQCLRAVCFILQITRSISLCFSVAGQTCVAASKSSFIGSPILFLLLIIGHFRSCHSAETLS